MSTIDLVAKIKTSSKRMTKTQRKKRLVEAHIIKDNGQFDSRYFSRTTVNASKRIIAKA
ncbi:hypothetical protein [Malaciobacter mytili]|uniref:hypothetical protein n=1 Tax=Malaciobacter mytili TaxID=603050 RepID=UPI003A8BEC67